MKKLISIIGGAWLLFSSPLAKAQTPVSECYTQSNPSDGHPSATLVLPCYPSTTSTTDFNQFYKWMNNYVPIDGVGSPMYLDKTIKVVIHVINPPSSLGLPKLNFDASDVPRINSIIGRINNSLSSVPTPIPATAALASSRVTSSRFQIKVEDIIFHTSALRFEDIFSGGSVGVGVYGGNLAPYMVKTDKVLNIFFMYTAFDDGPLGGWAPGSPYGSDMLVGSNSAISFIVTENYYRVSDERASNNLFHEIGHIMGTHHIFDGSETCDETNFDYTVDLYGTGSAKDCPSSNLLSDNFMSYNHPYNNHITPQQIGRWHRNSQFLSSRRFVYNTWPEDINHSNVGQGQFRPFKITKNETWDFDIKMYSDIIVKSGNKLSIKCRVLMPYHSNIIVEPGAELEIDGGIITSHHDTTMWYGISVWGDASKSQNVTSDQGLLTMKNGATISNALHAVMLADAVYGSGARNGGIAHIDESHFINNRRSIGFHDYRNLMWEFKGGAWTRTWLRPNASWINKTSFEVNNDMIRDPKGQVTMSGVDGVAISGCTFTNTMPYASTTTRCTTGCPQQDAIVTWNASFLLDQWKAPVTTGPITASYIKGFRNGVLAQSFRVANNFKVQNTTFERNYYGITSSAVNGFKIKDNNFLIDNPVISTDPSFGMNIVSSSMYQVYNNSFNRSSLPTSGSISRIGVEVFEGGRDNNTVRNNTYKNLRVGNLSNRQNTNLKLDDLDDNANTGLQFLCNNYEADITYAQFVDGTDANKHGMRYIQGELTKPAGNIFTARGAPIVRGLDIVVRQSGASPPVFIAHPIAKYYYSDLVVVEKPIRYSTIVTPVARPYEKICIIPESTTDPEGEGNTTGTAGYFAVAARRLADAFEDYSTNRFERIDSALIDMHSPYAELDRALHYMEAGQVAQGLANYYTIAATMPLTAQELNDFTIGATLMRMVASKYASNNPRWDTLSNTELDSLRYVRDHSKMWAHQRACAWLSYAVAEYCAMHTVSIPEPDTTNTSGNLRKSMEDKVTESIAHFDVKPNPSNAYFEVNYTLDGTTDAHLKISDVTGRTILEGKLPTLQKIYHINASDWASGVYLYQVVQNGKSLYNGKLIKQ